MSRLQPALQINNQVKLKMHLVYSLNDIIPKTKGPHKQQVLYYKTGQQLVLC